MAMTASFIFLICSFYCVSAVSPTERAALIQSTIAEVMEEDNRLAAQSTGQHLSSSLRKLRAFKQATPELQAHGSARLRFEKMVKIAERKIIEEERKAVGQDTTKLSDSYTQELLNNPGDILTAQEIYDVFQSSGCDAYKDTTSYDCSSDKDRVWRRPNGTCNNKDYPLYGAANSPMKRLLSPDYEDGISQPRGFFQLQGLGLGLPSTAFDSPNPSPRLISTIAIRDVEREDPVHSLMLMQFAQFMDHDLDFMPEYAEDRCTSCDINTDTGACLPILIPHYDSRMEEENAEECLHFSRSLPVCGAEETDSEEDEYLLWPRNHMNMITHFIDASTVYHHDPDFLNEQLRGEDGKLKMENEKLIIGDGSTEQLSMPVMDTVTVAPPIPCGTPDCKQYIAGDARANENPGLITMHTMWVREHNRIAKEIKKMNKDKEDEDKCDDDTIFNTARHAVTCQIQHIFYNHYLPEILGQRFWEEMGLDNYIEYDDEVKPNIPNAFASAAFRYGHSQVQPQFEPRHKDSEPEFVNLVESFFNTAKYRQYGTDPYLRGLMEQPARRLDEFITDSLTEGLFGNSHTHGLDLASLNLNRGRDHGIPPYLVWRNWAQRACPSSVTVVPRFRNQNTEIRLRMIYGSLDSVDLFVGGLAERPLRGGIIGPTFGCILAHTFLALRDGDRFFYQNKKIFTHEQISSIKNVNFTHVICANTESDYGKIRSNPFVLNSPHIPCDGLTPLDLSVWDCDYFDPEKRSAEGPEKTQQQSILNMLKEIVEKMETQEAHVASDTKEDKKTVMTDAELAEKLESLIKKVKK